MWRQIKSGTWLTRERLRVYPLILLVMSIAAAVIWIALADGMIDRDERPIGTDFSNVWVAGKLVLDGQPDAPFDPVRQFAAEKAAFGGRDVPFYGWHYPPLFLLVAAALALLPYGWALLAWTGLTLPAYLFAVRAILEHDPEKWIPVFGKGSCSTNKLERDDGSMRNPARARSDTLILALAFPAVFVNLGHGQNGFLTAALLGGGLVLLDARPIAAGVLFGLLAYKPQFGLLIPLVLLVTGRWRVIAAAAATVLAGVAVTLALFGPKVWLAFAEFAAFTRFVVLEAGDTGWEKIQSLFSAVRSWGAAVEMAYAAQSALALMVAVTLIWLWRSRAASELKAAALACACLLATPYVLDYDLVVLAVAIAFFTRYGLAHGFRDYEISVLACVWVVPLVARGIAGATGLPLGLIAMLALYALTLRRAALELAAHAPERGDLVRA
jgi:alpha-1,2-mannosyltransferase